MGGSCVELACAGARVLLDLGLPLDAPYGSTPPLPPVTGLAGGDDPSLLGVIISHGHPDHYGLVAAAAPSVPRYIGEAAHRILAEAAFFTPLGVDLEPTGFLRDREPFVLGPFRITPYPCDHSAFDAYGLLVEAGGRQLFYSGDFRAHGRKRAVFERLLREALRPDTLLLEGTQIGKRADGDGRGIAHRPVFADDLLPDGIVYAFRERTRPVVTTQEVSATKAARHLTAPVLSSSLTRHQGESSISDGSRIGTTTPRFFQSPSRTHSRSCPVKKRKTICTF